MKPNPDETKIIEQYHRLTSAKKELHKSMRRVVISTRLGRQIKRPDDDIELEIGNGILSSCARYGQVRYFVLGSSQECELDEDVDTIEYLIKEIKSRFLQFQKNRDSKKLEYLQSKRKFAQKHFRTPLDTIDRIFTTNK